MDDLKFNIDFHSLEGGTFTVNTPERVDEMIVGSSRFAIRIMRRSNDEWLMPFTLEPAPVAKLDRSNIPAITSRESWGAWKETHKRNDAQVARRSRLRRAIRGIKRELNL